MKNVTVILHRDPEAGWWAVSPDVAGYTAADPELEGLRALVREGLEFFLGEPVVVDERLAEGVALPFTLSGWQIASSHSRATGSVVALADHSTIVAGWQRVPSFT